MLGINTKHSTLYDYLILHCNDVTRAVEQTFMLMVILSQITVNMNVCLTAQPIQQKGSIKAEHNWSFVRVSTGHQWIFSQRMSHTEMAFNVVQSSCHYIDVIMGAIATQITSLTIVYSTVYSGADQRKHQSSALAFVWGIHRGPVNSPHKWPVTRTMFPFDDVIMHCFLHKTLGATVFCILFA